jgi:hypothetical protein
MNPLRQLDDQLFFAINSFARHTAWLHAPFLAFAKYGPVLFGLLLLAGVLISRNDQARVLAAAGWACIATLVAVGLNQPVGHIFAEARPAGDLRHASDDQGSVLVFVCSCSHSAPMKLDQLAPGLRSPEVLGSDHYPSNAIEPWSQPIYRLFDEAVPVCCRRGAYCALKHENRDAVMLNVGFQVRIAVRVGDIEPSPHQEILSLASNPHVEHLRIVRIEPGDDVRAGRPVSDLLK